MYRPAVGAGLTWIGREGYSRRIPQKHFYAFGRGFPDSLVKGPTG
jgi:hypothetical protein